MDSDSEHEGAFLQHLQSSAPRFWLCIAWGSCSLGGKSHLRTQFILEEMGNGVAVNTGSPPRTVWSGWAAVLQRRPQSDSRHCPLTEGSVPLVSSGLVTRTLVSLWAGAPVPVLCPFTLGRLFPMNLSSLHAVGTGPLWAELSSRVCGLFSLLVVS